MVFSEDSFFLHIISQKKWYWCNISIQQTIAKSPTVFFFIQNTLGLKTHRKFWINAQFPVNTLNRNNLINSSSRVSVMYMNNAETQLLYLEMELSIRRNVRDQIVTENLRLGSNLRLLYWHSDVPSTELAGQAFSLFKKTLRLYVCQRLVYPKSGNQVIKSYRECNIFYIVKT